MIAVKSLDCFRAGVTRLDRLPVRLSCTSSSQLNPLCRKLFHPFTADFIVHLITPLSACIIWNRFMSHPSTVILGFFAAFARLWSEIHRSVNYLDVLPAFESLWVAFYQLLQRVFSDKSFVCSSTSRLPATRNKSINKEVNKQNCCIASCFHNFTLLGCCRFRF
jgi:hypothetical protein